MEYAIIQSGGKQFRVSPNEIVRVPSISKQVGDEVQFDVLVQSAGESVDFGAPFLDSKIVGEVVEHGRERKVIVFKMKRKKQYKKTIGHRQNFTAVRIGAFGAETGSKSEPESAPAEAAEPAEPTEVTENGA